ncbi:MAG: hypothetical protein U5K54_02695 [Cytophagales bacterium]|nr:hypothetical protein [Cytophagales bacterium]
MKTKLSILLVSLTLVTMQACGPTAKNDEESADASMVETKDVALTRAEKRAKIEKERNEMELKKKG